MAKKDFIVVEQALLSSDPPTPAAGFAIIYPKTDGYWYYMASDGIPHQITSGISEDLAIAYAAAL